MAAQIDPPSRPLFFADHVEGDGYAPFAAGLRTRPGGHIGEAEDPPIHAVLDERGEYQESPPEG
jgi:hypothetical protein